MMSKTGNFLCWFLSIIVALCILNFPVTVRGQEKNPLEGMNELSAIVYTQVSWDKHDEFGGNLEETGSMQALIFGSLALDQNRKGVLLFFPGSEGMQGGVNYQNITTDKKTGELYIKEEGSGSIQVLSPRFLTNPQTEGHLELMAFGGPGGRAHALQLAGQVDPASMMKAMTSQENMDHYTFSVATPIKTGVTDKDGNSEAGLRGIQFALIAEALKGRAISNSLSWTAQEIEYSIQHQNFMGTMYGPPEAKNRDVNYTVRWNIGEIKIPCDIIKSKIIDAKINKKLYSSDTIKDYYKKKFGEEGYKEYNNGIEKIARHVYAEKCQTAEEAEEFIENLTEDDIKWMENNPPPPPPGGGSPPEVVDKAKLDALINLNNPCDIKEMTLYANRGKNKDIMIEFEKNKDNVWIGEQKIGYLKVEFEYLQEFGPEAGEALFNSIVEHEMTHKEQYAKDCFPKTIDKLSKYEMEAYDAEIKCLEDFYDNHC
jgi:hypothetical protein